MKLTSLVPAAIALVLVNILAGCTGELDASRGDGSTTIRLKWEAANAEKQTNATRAAPGQGQPPATGKS